jgi:uncharacterized protein
MSRKSSPIGRISWMLAAAIVGGCSAHAPTPVSTTTAPAASVPPAKKSTPPSEEAAFLSLAPAERGKRFVALLAAHGFKTAFSFFDDAMKTMKVEGVAAAWGYWENETGAFRRATAVSLDRRGDLTAANVRCEMATGVVNTRVVFDGRGRVTGLFFKPVQPPWQPPSYAQPSRFKEEGVLIGKGEWATPGTLTLPPGEGRFRALILVHGSGPNDRDEASLNSPQRVFKDLAWGLASRGIAVVRYDKRTLTHARKLNKAMDSFTHRQEYVEDALAALEFLRQDKRIDSRHIYLLGHSEGGSVAPRIGAASKQIAGLVVLAGATRDFSTIIIDQYNYLAKLDGEIDAEERAAIEEMKRRIQPLRDPKLLDQTPAEKLPSNIPAVYWKDVLAHQPVATAKRYRKPMLILQGERDYQVTMDDFAGWKKGLARHQKVTFQSYPGLDHHFVDGKGPSKPEDYRKPGHVDEKVIGDIATWIVRQKS